MTPGLAGEDPLVKISLIVVLAVAVLGLLVALFLVLAGRNRLRRTLDRSLEATNRLRQALTKSEAMVATLTASTDQLRAGIDGLGAAIWDWDMQTREFNVSDHFLEITGFDRASFPRNMARITKFVHEDDIPGVMDIFRDYMAKKIDRCGFEMRMLFGDGEYHWVQARALVTLGPNGNPQRIVGSISDISEKVLAEEERDRLFNLSVDMLSVGGFDGSFHQLNPAWVRVLGWSRDDILGEKLLHFVHPDDVPLMESVLEDLQGGETVRGEECRFRCRDGSYRWLSWSSFPYPEHELIFSVVRDVTEQKEAETQVLDYQDRLRSLSNQLALVEDRQRQQLANAIHDGLAQQLFGIRAQVTLLKYPESLDDYQAALQEILDIIDDTMKEARSLSFELFPPVLHEVGLEAALTWLAHNFQSKTGVTCNVLVDGEGEELPDDLRAMAYQSVRELLNNVYKHAEATEVIISINYVPNFVTLLVDDNGVGFEISRTHPEPTDQSSGFGLFSIRERLRSLGGRMLVDAKPGHGSRIFLSIPRQV
jgi:PAS domain S-box-containing protein